MLVVIDCVVVDLLAELAELIVGVICVTGFAQGTVLGRLDFRLDPFVDLAVVTGGIKALS